MTALGVHRPLCPSGRAALGADSETPCAPGSRPYVLGATILASAMAFIDGSIVTIALPALQADLDAAFASLQWVVNGYALLLGALILVGGAAGDRFGRRRVFAIGLAVFGLASIACATAASIQWLILARAAQGIGAALLVPQSLAIIAAAFPRDIRGRAIGLWAGASAMTTALGPPLGGILIEWLGWRSVFWINLPLCAAALWLTAAHVPESRAEAADGPLDWLGGALAIVAFGSLAAGLTVFAVPESATTPAVVLLALGVAGLFALLRAEKSAANPLLPLSLFASRAFTGANLVTILLYGALSAVLFLLPFDLIERRGLSAIEVGFLLLPFGLIIGIGSHYAGGWADRVGPRRPLVLGGALVSLASAGLALDLGGVAVGVLAPVLVMSVGMAFVAAPLTTAVMNAASDSQSGAASGVNNAASRLAGLFAVAIVGAAANVVFLASIDAATATARFGELPPLVDPARAGVEAAFVDAYRFSMALATGAGVSAVIIAALLVPAKRAL
jgi:EmrB/QacA subfamily drug resistance transporter